MLSPVGTLARALEIDDEFIVFQGSTARKEGVPSWTSYKALHDQGVQEGKLTASPDPALYVFAEDIPFSSPSAAAAVVFGGGRLRRRSSSAAVVFGGNQRGPFVWRTEGGAQTYREWQESKLEQAGLHAPHG